MIGLLPMHVQVLEAKGAAEIGGKPVVLDLDLLQAQHVGRISATIRRSALSRSRIEFAFQVVIRRPKCFSLASPARSGSDRARRQGPASRRLRRPAGHGRHGAHTSAAAVHLDLLLRVRRRGAAASLLLNRRTVVGDGLGSIRAAGTAAISICRGAPPPSAPAAPIDAASIPAAKSTVPILMFSTPSCQ